MTRAPRARVPSAGPLRLRAIVVLTALSLGVTPPPLGAVQGGSLDDAVSEEIRRQRPGPANALGRIKFMFPNEFNVYLHDTPDRSLFAREERLFSHGCIRVEDPLGLAALLLDGWDEERLRRAIAAGETRTLELARPLPVLVLYWTAATDLHGEVHFYRDIYQRDAALLDVLDRGRSPAPDGRE